MSQVKILWVQDDFDGPYNGLAEYNGEKLWFVLQHSPKMVSSTNIPVPKIIDISSGESDDENWEDSQFSDVNYEDRLFNLIRLEPSVLERVTKNHEEYCKTTGAPLLHGDPIRIMKRTIVEKMSSEKLASFIKPGEDSVEVTPSSLGNVIKHNHSIDPASLVGEYVLTIKQSDFVNYLVPRTVVRS